MDKLMHRMYFLTVVANNERFFYLPVSPTDRDWGLFVSTTGDSRIAAHAGYPPPNHPPGYYFSWEQGRILSEYQVIYITEGQGFFESRFTPKRRIRAGDAFLLFPGVWHRYAPLKTTGWHEHWVGFDGEYARRLMEKDFFYPRTPVLHPGLDEGMAELFTQMYGLMKQEPVGYQQMMSATTVQILARLHAAERAQTAGGGRIETVIRKAKCLLVEHIDRPIDMEELAVELNVGYSWFRQMFRHHTGLSPHQYYLQLRLHRAQSLLRSTDTSVKSIASLMGFESPYYFSRLFKKKTGKSPSQWRQCMMRNGKCRTRKN